MDSEVPENFEEIMTSLDLTPGQKEEFRASPERAWGWVQYARDAKTLTNPVGFILSQIRLELDAPNLLLWRTVGVGEGEEEAVGDYPTLLRCCASLVRSTGHEYSDDDLREEFARLGNLRKVGNGALLTQKDETALLARAEKMRSRHAEGEEARQQQRQRWTQRYYNDLLREKKITKEYYEGVQRRLK